MFDLIQFFAAKGHSRHESRLLANGIARRISRELRESSVERMKRDGKIRVVGVGPRKESD